MLPTAASTPGSGVIMGEDSEGKYAYILTCAHNKQQEQHICPALDGTDYVAEIVGYDKRTDIGVLRIKAKFVLNSAIPNSLRLVKKFTQSATPAAQSLPAPLPTA